MPALQPNNQRLYVNVGKRLGVNNGNSVEWYPATALQIIAYQPFAGRLTGTQTSNMISAALRPPNNHKDTILGTDVRGGFHHFAFSGATAGAQQGGLGHSQMTAGTNFTQIPGKWLVAPTLRYTKPANVTVQGASWDLRDTQFMRPASLRLFATISVLNLSGPLPPNFRPNLTARLRHHGMQTHTHVNVQISQISIAHQPLTTAWEQTFLQSLRAAGATFPACPVIVVLDDFSYDVYASIKRVGDLEAGIPTICMKRANVDDIARGGFRDLQKLSNIALKFNFKTGGDNHHLAQQALQALRNATGSATTIVIGADVTHPGNGSKVGTPSIAAVVGSTDDNFVKFPGSMRLQHSNKEDIVELAEMVKERILAWAHLHQNQMPANVLFYRDGVSESQYDILQRRELPQVQVGVNLAYLELKRMRGQGASKDDPPGKPPALEKVQGKGADKMRMQKEQEEKRAFQIESDKKNRPVNLTFIVVGKRHNTRFYPTRNEDFAKQGDRPNTNVKPGLVVDQVITHPYRMDFYLQSHYPVQGTGRSAHYVVLRNNMGLNVDQLQSITHSFCYVYARATKGVSYCAPAYYADRLCDRGRAYIRNLLVNHNDPPNLPQPSNYSNFDAFKTAMVTALQNSSYYRPQAGNSQNPWHWRISNLMFYL